MEKDQIKILLAEDDPNLGTILKSYLDAKGFPTKLCTNGEIAFELYCKEPFDLCLLDIMMPLKDGFTLAKEIRKSDKKTPIIFLSAKSLQDDVLEGFRIGADDYLTKPFSMDELTMRINAVMRRIKTSKNSLEENVYKIGNYNFDYNHQSLYFNKVEQKLTSKEADLLKLLADHMNDVLDRSYALKKIWTDDSYYNSRSMDVYIAKLRKYLKDDSNIEILNIHGKGFKLLCSE